jgi:hypothetical protein
MEMPEVLQMLIQDFARPVIRPDWRTCKALQAASIREFNKESERYFPYKIPANRTVPDVTMYARLKALEMFKKPQEKFVLWLG